MSDELFDRGLVPISGDPVTNGHVDLIVRASRKCKTLVVLVANNEAKTDKYLFSLEERLEIARRALSHLPNVEVVASSGLLVDVFMEQGCDRVFRGIRNEEDRAYELHLASLNNTLFPGFGEKFEFLLAPPELTHVSSSLVKGLVLQRVDVSRFVPIFIKALLEVRLRGQTMIGITGGIASGKTWVGKQLAYRLGGTYLNFDDLIRELYEESSRGAQMVRNELAKLFGSDVLSGDGIYVDRDVLKRRIFTHSSSDEMMKKVVELTSPHVMRLYRQKLTQAKGFVIVEWAQMAQMEMSYLVNHQVIVVESADREMFLEKRGIDQETFTRVSSHQWGAQRQVEALQTVIDRDGYGKVLSYENHYDPVQSDEGLAGLVDTIRGLF